MPTDDGKYLEITGVVIVSNLTERDLERAEDNVEKVRELLCVEAQPGWHYFHTDI
ncbi:hypothetical protein CC2G_008480 [Coprinopsis cinerea AmutBmut pab1-1]|nr:hypothetical protein CC2G_008480 [Coprinopsis cinerea AmutBmut pab1-1]